MRIPPFADVYEAHEHLYWSDLHMAWTLSDADADELEWCPTSDA